MRIKTLFAVAGTLALATPAFAASNPFLGVWSVVGAKPAPWSGPSASAKVDPNLAHQGLIKIGDGRVYGPRSVACRSAHYSVAKVAPTGVFDGNLKNPQTEASALGLKGDKILTLQESCTSHDIDYAMINRHTVLLDVSNVIYTLKRR